MRTEVQSWENLQWESGSVAGKGRLASDNSWMENLAVSFKAGQSLQASMWGYPIIKALPGSKERSVEKRKYRTHSEDGFLGVLSLF